MKTLMMGLMAAAFLFGAASLASADMMGSSFHDLTAIDSAGITTVAISAPSAPVGFVEVLDKIALDSNGIWLVNDIYATPAETGMMAGSSMEEKVKDLYCFDSTSKFCARAY